MKIATQKASDWAAGKAPEFNPLGDYTVQAEGRDISFQGSDHDNRETAIDEALDFLDRHDVTHVTVTDPHGAVIFALQPDLDES